MNKHPKLIELVIVILLVATSGILAVGTVFAVNDPTAYTLLEPGVVGLDAGSQQAPTNFLVYVNSFYKVLLWLTIALAIVYIIIGGVEYMLSASGSGKSDGREKVGKAFQGLAIALLSYLILYTINPDLVQWNLNICQLGTANCPPTTAAPATNQNTISNFSTD